MYYTYILFSRRLNKYYVGHTEHLENRLKDHNIGRTRFARSGMPWELIYYQEIPTRSEAMRLEKKVKSRGARRFLNDLEINIQK
jgi:putative endonuclease